MSLCIVTINIIRSFRMTFILIIITIIAKCVFLACDLVHIENCHYTNYFFLVCYLFDHQFFLWSIKAFTKYSLTISCCGSRISSIACFRCWVHMSTLCMFLKVFLTVFFQATCTTPTSELKLQTMRSENSSIHLSDLLFLLQA
jgi:hypothetical protein